MQPQEINLYRSFEAPRPAPNFLSWKRFGYCQLAFLSLFVVMYLFSSWHVHHLNVTKAELQAKATTMEKEFYALRDKFPPLFFGQDVGQSINALKRDLEAQKKVFDTLVTPLSFSQDLSALSTNIVPNVWLDTISITKSGNNIVLHGKSTNIENIQQFLGNIIHDTRYKDFIVSVSNIEEADKKAQKGGFNFELTIIKKPL